MCQNDQQGLTDFRFGIIDIFNTLLRNDCQTTAYELLTYRIVNLLTKFLSV